MERRRGELEERSEGCSGCEPDVGSMERFDELVR